MTSMNHNFSFGVVFKITDLDTGYFYIGETTSYEKFIHWYPGSGRKWKKWYNSHEEDEYLIEVLHYETESINRLYEREVEEIRKYCEFDGEKWIVVDDNCFNLKTTKQSVRPTESFSVCPECGSKYRHKSFCSKASDKKTCAECGGIDGKHRKSCSQYKPVRICDECGSIGSVHKKSCSRFLIHHVCDECGGTHGHHYSSCSRYVEKSKCEYCHSTPHTSDCIYYKRDYPICDECGGIKGNHKKGCSKRKELGVTCVECGKVARGPHKSWCSKYKKPKSCPECGKTGRARHKPGCSRYKSIPTCSECGGKDGHHKKICSKKELR